MYLEDQRGTVLSSLYLFYCQVTLHDQNEVAARPWSLFNRILSLHLNTFAASYLNTQGLNNSCLKSPASTLVDLTLKSRALRSFSLNQLRNLSL